jgi:GDSL-like Lipase/Acylhydrolase family
MLKPFFSRRIWIGICTIVAILFSVQIHSSGVEPRSLLAQKDRIEHSDRALPSTVVDPAQYGTGIRRTLYRLATSTPTHRNTIRILFYGQSITQQEWWLEVVRNLRQQFPYANLIVENRAIGGFASPLLIRTAEHDLYPFYPDLMVFHVYGDEKNYEAIIANTRRRTTSEIAIASDHLDWLPTGTESEDSEELKRYQWHNNHARWLQALAQKYGCEFIDVRRAWKQYLELHALQPQALLSDNIHLNEQGNHLMARSIANHILESPIPKVENLDNSIIEYRNSDLHWHDNKLSLTFEGNRVDLVTQPSTNNQFASAELLIDGKPPSQISSLYSISRPSDAPGVEWPGILQIASASSLMAEDWALTISEANSQMDLFSFDLYGSKTGFDGSGNSKQKFVSNSGKIVIEPQNWWLENAYQFTKETIPIGFQIRWRVEPMFNDIYTSPVIRDSMQEYTTIVAQNLTNSRHTLEITTLRGTTVPIEAIRVYHPSVD